MRHFLKRSLSKVGLRVIALVRSAGAPHALEHLRQRLTDAVLHLDDLNEWRVRKARELGVKVGKDCRLFSMEFSTEPYLIELGDHVVVSSHTQFITHDGGTWVFDDLADLPHSMNVYGKIKVGNNVFIGIGCTILCNVAIGDNCVIGAGSVVRSNIPADSVAFGNPAKVVMALSLYKKLVTVSDRMMVHDPWDPFKHAAIKAKFGVS